jgi:hypothetical protein
MASPFSVFRRYMKPMMVVLCGMAMLAFVVVDPLMQYLGASGSGGGMRRDSSEVVVTWNGGELTEAELAALVQRRHILRAFLERVFQEGTFAAFREGAGDLPLAVQPLSLPVELEQGVERDVVLTQIISDKARGLGMSVSDEAALEYLDKLGRNRVTFEQMNVMLSQMFANRPVTSQFVLDALRDELLKQNFLASYKFSEATQMPEQRWHDWLQVNDRVIVEAAALKTSDFLDDVKPPTDTEIRDFYEEYKDREVTPDFPLGNAGTELPSPKPGFKVPRHLRFQYLEGKYDEVLQQLMSTVTDEEIAKFYEDNKDLFIRADADPSPAEPAPGAEPAPPADGATEELFGTPSTDSPPAEAPPQADPQDPTADEPGALADPPAPPAEEPAPPAEEPAPPTNEPAEPNGQSRRATSQKQFKLAAFQDTPAAEEPPTEEPLAGEPATEAETPVTDPAESEATPPAEPPDVETPLPASTEPPAAETPAATTSEPAAETTGEPAPKYQTLDEVREEIRRRLAGEKVNEQLSAKMKSLLSTLNKAYLPYFDKQLSARAKNEPEPAPPKELTDLQALAEPNGLQYHDTGSVSLWDFRQMPLARTVDADESADPRLSLLMLALHRLKNYEPVVTRDIDGNQYLAMKTADTPGYVPELKDVRDQVVEAWKRQKASELAIAKAKELAAQIEKDGVTLGDKFANNAEVEVVVTDPFTYLTYGDISPTTRIVNFRLSDPKPIVAAGPEFMETVFGLEEGKVGAVLNHDHSIAYIVRVQQHLDDRETLQRDFLQAMADGWFGGNTMALGHLQLARAALYTGLLSEAGVQWKRPADQRDVEEPAEG